MLRNTTLIACLALALLTVGCSNTSTSTPIPPPDTRAADVQAVKDLETSWVKDANSKDADKWAGYFAEDGSALYPGAATLNGKAAIKAAMAPYFTDPNFALTFQSTRTVASKGGDGMIARGGCETKAARNFLRRTPRMRDKPHESACERSAVQPEPHSPA